MEQTEQQSVQLEMTEPVDPENQQSAGNSFSAAAMVAQYTGDMPENKPEELLQTEGLTTDQAIELAEQRQDKLEQ